MNFARTTVDGSLALRDEWNNLNHQLWEHILIAIGVIGVVGLLLEQGMNLIAHRFDYRSK